MCCALAIIYFYSLLTAGVLYPFKSHFEQVVSGLRTAVFATLAASWAIWLGMRGKRSLSITMLKAGVATQASFTVFAVIGLRVAIASLRSPLDLVFPSTFFDEYNWLTFILEVAPVTSATAGVLLYLSSGKLLKN